MKIAVYCGSKSGNDPAYLQAAKDLGRFIGEGGHTLVYGGATEGLMGAVADAVLEASSGAIRCSTDVRSQLFSTTSSGSQYIQNASCKKIKVRSSSGSVNAENLRGGDMEFEASSGSVRLTDVVADKDLRIETSSGSVRLDRCDAKDINIKAGSGSVKGSLLTGKVFKVKTGSGSAKYPEDGNNGTCTVTTTSGSVNITVEP